MKRLPYTIKTISPILISTVGRDKNLVDTMDYIPGSSVLGVFANAFQKKHNIGGICNDNNFYRLFLSDNVRYLNAYIGKNNKDFIPAPFFIKKIKDDDYNVKSALIPTKDTKPLKKYIFFNGSNFEKIEVEKNISFHSVRGIKDNTRLSGHSEKEGIFNYEAIAPGQVFKGFICGSEDNLRELKNIGNNTKEIRIGKSKSVQYGRTEIKFGEIEDFTHHNRYNNVPPVGNMDKNEVAIVFMSPTILLNENGFSEVSFKTIKEEINKITGLTCTIEKEKSFFETETVEHFVSVWRMKRPMRQAVSAGSVVVVNFNETDVATIKNNLLKLEEKGLGEYVNEGFGETDVIFPEEIKPDANTVKISTSPEEEIEKPEITAAAISITEGIIKNALVKEAANIAYKDAVEFAEPERKPSNNLLGRLEILILIMEKENFIKAIKGNENQPALKDIARNQLKKCRNKTVSLYNRIAEGEPKMKDFLSSFTTVQSLAREINKDISKDDALYNELYRVYWSNFFRAMRKIGGEK